ncbi:hypothetical protein SAMN05421678_12615 [Actinopolymorpha cephalotaxi]|uniref:Uncharacterized protein n=1 Tax=Actinopolymorpha cephalotaxi TaxID=504797 RepID=A0A1I3BRY2_9ACTN|nr:hypothetical protein [Actinopolymorpha cephalotaxi]SFH64679.1 hypothetical protein SAMN05421678_12615 [Actinopolymorpha cephalotaxi]
MRAWPRCNYLGGRAGPDGPRSYDSRNDGLDRSTCMQQGRTELDGASVR